MFAGLVRLKHHILEPQTLRARHKRSAPRTVTNQHEAQTRL
jgi:hypothetical protein